MVSRQDGDTSSTWVYVPYTCYYHLYNRSDIYECASRESIDWIHATGDSQEREMIAVFKMLNGTLQEATKFENADFIMHGSPNNLRITWQFYTETFLWRSGEDTSRDFAGVEKKIFDHFNIVPSEVRDYCRGGYARDG